MLSEAGESFAWVEDIYIAVGQGPALLQLWVSVGARINLGTLLIKDEVFFEKKLDCRWKFLLETM